MSIATAPSHARSLSEFQVHDAPALAVPTLRMLVLSVSADQAEVFPVLAIESAAVESYVTEDGASTRYPRTLTDHDLKEAKFRTAGTAMCRQPLFVDPAGDGITDLESYRAANPGRTARLVVADWPAGDDAKRLAPLYESMRATA